MIYELFILKVGQVHFRFFFYYKLFTNKKNVLSFIYVYHYLHFFQKWTCPTFKINGLYLYYRVVTEELKIY